MTHSVSDNLKARDASASKKNDIQLSIVRYTVPANDISQAPPPIEGGSSTTAASPDAGLHAKKNVVGNVTPPTLPKPKNGVINTLSGFMMLPEEQTEYLEDGGADVTEVLRPVRIKQRRMAERRRDPIVAKNEGRKEKVNLNSFKSKYLALKKR